MKGPMQKTEPSKIPVERGASLNKVSSGSRAQAWLTHHRASALSSAQKLLMNPLSSLMTWMVIGIAMSLPMSLLLVVDNIKYISERWEGKPQLSIYLHRDISTTAVLKFQNILQNTFAGSDIKYISPEDGLAEFKQHSGFAAALALIDENPLPPVYIVEPRPGNGDELARLAKTLQTYPEVDFVQLDTEWIQKLHQMTTLVEYFVYWLGGLLFFGVLLVISNTIRLVIENRREEIVVVKLVGGTDAYVRRPLMYTGLWYGLLGALVACLLVQSGVVLLTNPVRQLAQLYGSDFSIIGMGLFAAIQLLLIGSLLGLGGAWLAVSRYLRVTQPR